MKNPVLDTWHYVCARESGTIVIPDGCRDLIVKYSADNAPVWFISDLYDGPGRAVMLPGEEMVGFRLQPGTEIDANRLLAAVRGLDVGSRRLVQAVLDHTRLSTKVEDALACISDGQRPLERCARLLGVGPRTLQRLLISRTGRSPRYWMMLARVRKAGRALAGNSNLAELAVECGYSDQSHMTREFKRWLGVTPSKLAASDSISNQLAQPGYG